MTAGDLDWITAVEAAEILHRKYGWVIEQCRNGRLRAQQPGGPNTQWLVHRQSAIRLATQINP